MAETLIEESTERIIVELDPGGPVELTGLSDSFAALARYYERYYRPPGSDIDTAPKLFITRLATGSIIAEIAPYALFFGQIYVAMGGAVTVGDFTHRFVQAVRAFSDPHGARSSLAASSAFPLPSRDDASDLRAFLRPLTGRRGASLGIRHAHFRATDGQRETVAEFTFDEAEINRAAANIEKVLSTDDSPPEEINEAADLSRSDAVFSAGQQGASEGNWSDC
jgi:hypothetical protein